MSQMVDRRRIRKLGGNVQEGVHEWLREATAPPRPDQVLLDLSIEPQAHPPDLCD